LRKGPAWIRAAPASASRGSRPAPPKRERPQEGALRPFHNSTVYAELKDGTRIPCTQSVAERLTLPRFKPLSKIEQAIGVPDADAEPEGGHL
jgi:hypothetical protein